MNWNNYHNVEERNYGLGTSVTVAYPFGFYVSAKAMCSDGIVRKVTRISETADTVFSVPASVRVKGKHVSGFITFDTADGFSTETDDDPMVVKFIAHTYGKNGALLPGLGWKRPATDTTDDDDDDDDQPRESLSNNHFSHDMQVDDVLTYLRGNIPEHEYNNLLHAFPEVDRRILDGASFDTDKMGVDIEWSSWVTDWIEQNTPVLWEDGEPWIHSNPE